MGNLLGGGTHTEHTPTDGGDTGSNPASDKSYKIGPHARGMRPVQGTCTNRPAEALHGSARTHRPERLAMLPRRRDVLYAAAITAAMFLPTCDAFTPLSVGRLMSGGPRLHLTSHPPRSVGTVSLRALEEDAPPPTVGTTELKRTLSSAANPHSADTMLDDKVLLDRDGGDVSDPLGVAHIALIAENMRFKCHASVNKWGAFQARPPPAQHRDSAVRKILYVETSTAVFTIVAAATVEICGAVLSLGV